MSAKDWLTVSVSFIALAAALYGIFERRLAARQASRIRVSSICDDLARLDIEQSDAEAGGEPAVNAASFRPSRNARRRVLASAARELVSTQRLRLSSGEYATLATALKRGSGDWDEATRYFERAIQAAKADSSEAAIAYRALGRHFADLNMMSAATAHFESAIAATRDESTSARFTRAETYALWSAAMVTLDPQHSRELLELADAEVDAMPHPGVQAQARRSVAVRSGRR